jgi:hypothetical protein
LFYEILFSGTPAPNIASLASNISNVNLTKPQPPASKPSFSRPQNGGPIHPSSRPPPPPIGNKTNLGRNQTIGHGPQGRPQIPNYEKRRSRVCFFYVFFIPFYSFKNKKKYDK